eukprot:SAG11_NODE_478_length_9117_cov_6.916168_8_plen_494_part_00
MRASSLRLQLLLLAYAVSLLAASPPAAEVARVRSKHVRAHYERQPLVPHMGFMTSYSFNPPLMRGWVTHGLDFYCEIFPDCRSQPRGWWQLNASLAAWERYRIPSLYSDLPTGYASKPTETGVFVRGVGLAMGWEAALERIFATQIQPNLGHNKALRGVFIGDELCCGGPAPAKCWAEGYAPLTHKLRALMGPEMIIYANECAGEFDPIQNADPARNITEIPPEFDLISLDVYADYLPPVLPPGNASNEVTAAKTFYKSMMSRMHPHQKAVLVPGTFACSNATTISGKGFWDVFPLQAQQRILVAKLEEYFDWAKAEPRIGGFCPWHFNTRWGMGGANNARSTVVTDPTLECDMALGAIEMLEVVATLQDIGAYIVNRVALPAAFSDHNHWNSANARAKLEDGDGTTAVKKMDDETAFSGVRVVVNRLAAPRAAPQVFDSILIWVSKYARLYPVFLCGSTVKGCLLTGVSASRGVRSTTTRRPAWSSKTRGSI